MSYDQDQVARMERLAALEADVEASKRATDLRFANIKDKLEGLRTRQAQTAKNQQKMALIGVFVVVILAIMASEAGVPVWDALKAFM